MKKMLDPIQKEVRCLQAGQENIHEKLDPIQKEVWAAFLKIVLT